jgi:uncharacterized Zn-binding protein involved in type VI secretion
MAKYINGSIKFPSALKPTGAQPLDDRTVVKTFNDLLDVNTFTIDGASAAYPGMRVTVIDENKIYVLKGTLAIDDNGEPIEGKWEASDHTQSDNWVAVGTGDSTGDFDDISGRVDDLEERMSDAENALQNISYPVTDVKVNGETVVKDGVAEITIDTGLTESEVQNLIDSSFNEFVAEVTDNNTVDTFKELVDYAAEHKSEIGDLVAAVGEKIESINVNGVDATVVEGAATVEIQADDIALGTAITGTDNATVYDSTTKLSVVLQGINDSIRAAVAGGVISVASGDSVINVNNGDPNNPKVTLTVEEITDDTINAGHIGLIKGDNGLYGVMYYEGDDAE